MAGLQVPGIGFASPLADFPGCRRTIDGICLMRTATKSTRGFLVFGSGSSGNEHTPNSVTPPVAKTISLAAGGRVSK